MTSKLRKAVQQQKKQTKKPEKPITGILGIPINGQKRVEVQGRNGFVYVRLRNNENEVIQAFNNQVSPAYNLPVLVERQGTRYIVTSVDTQRYNNNWDSYSAFVPRHGGQHSFDVENGGGGDIVWVHGRQFMPLLTIPSGSVGANNVLLTSYTLRNADGTWKYVGNTGTQNLSSYNPVTGSQAVMGIVYLDTVSGNPGFVLNSGTYFPNTITGTSQIVPYLPAITNPNWIPDSAIRLITGTSKITWDNIYDVRQYFSTSATGTSGGSSSTGTSLSIQDEGSPLGTASTLNFVGDNISVSVSGTVARVYVTGSAGGGVPVGFNVSLPGVYAHATGSQSVSHNTTTVMNVGGIIRNDWNGWSASEPDKIRVDETGFYVIGGNMMWNSDPGNGRRITSLFVTGSSILWKYPAQNLLDDPSYAFPEQQVSTLQYLYSGSYIQLEASQNSSGTISNFAVGTTLWASKLIVSGSVQGSITNITNNVVNNIPGFLVQDEGVPLGTGTVFNFVGDNVTASISGSVVQVYVTGSSSGGGINTGTLDSLYLRLNTSNEPLTGKLRVLTSTTGTISSLFATTDRGSNVFGLEQYTDGHSTQPTAYLYRTPSNTGDIISAPMIDGFEDVSPGYISGSFIRYRRDNVEQFRVDTSGTAHSNNVPLVKEAPINGITYGRKDAGWVAVSGSSSGGSGDKYPFEARLTLETGTPFSTTSQTAKTIVYLTPYNGNQVSVYNGSSWDTLILSTDISITITGSTANLPYDIFIYNNAGVLALERVAWTDGTTRATAITTQDGVDVKSGDATRRLAGTIRITSTTGQCEVSPTFCGISNRYNQLPFEMYINPGYNNNNAQTTYTITSTTFVEANGAAKLNFVLCKPQPILWVETIFGLPAAGGYGGMGIGIDTTTQPKKTFFTAQSTQTTTTITDNNGGVPITAGAHYAALVLVYTTVSPFTIWADFGRTGGLSVDGAGTTLTGSILM